MNYSDEAVYTAVGCPGPSPLIDIMMDTP